MSSNGCEPSRNRRPQRPQSVYHQAPKWDNSHCPDQTNKQTNCWIYRWDINARQWIRQNLFHQMTVNLPEIGTQRRPLPAYRQAPKWDNPSYYEAIKSGHFKLLAKCNSCAKKTRLENTCTVIGFFLKLWGKTILFYGFQCTFIFQSTSSKAYIFGQ